MKLYLLSSNDFVMKHWFKSLKKYSPIKLDFINELNRPDDGIIFSLDTSLLESELQRVLNHSACKIMIFSTLPNFLDAQQYLTKGVVGYGNAMMHESHLQSAFQTLEEGKVWVYPDFISDMIEQLSQLKTKSPETNPSLDKLSSREKEVALCLAHGLTHHEIADELNITVRTIKAHCSSIYEKLSVKDRLSLSVLLHS